MSASSACACLQSASLERRVAGEVAQLTRDRDDLQRQCADLQRRQTQFQHEIRRKVGFYI